MLERITHHITVYITKKKRIYVLTLRAAVNALMNINYGKGQGHVIRRFRKYIKLRHHDY